MSHAFQLHDRCIDGDTQGQEAWPQPCGGRGSPVDTVQPQRMGLVSYGVAEERPCDRQSRVAALLQAPKPRPSTLVAIVEAVEL